LNYRNYRNYRTPKLYCAQIDLVVRNEGTGGCLSCIQESSAEGMAARMTGVKQTFAKRRNACSLTTSCVERLSPQGDRAFCSSLSVHLKDGKCETTLKTG
jgi:hypothetical protein